MKKNRSKHPAGSIEGRRFASPPRRAKPAGSPRLWREKIAKVTSRVFFSTLLAFVATVLWAHGAHAQSVKLSVDSDDQFAGVPFVLSVHVTDFDEDPAPQVEPLRIKGCRVTPLGVSPSVSSMTLTINGRTTEKREVTFVYRYRIEPQSAGTFTVKPIVVTQGSKKASSEQATFTANTLPKTNAMHVRLGLPQRPVWLGETFEVTLDWYLNQDPRRQSFVVPLFLQGDWVEVRPPKGEFREKLPFSAGDGEVALPFTQDKATLDGTEYSRLRFRARVTPHKAGVLTVAPTQVVARLRVGRGRDRFGFPVPRTKQFRAQDVVQTLEVRQPPQHGRPDSFANAVGAGFVIEAQADRTVVRVGDPIELRVLIKSKLDLDGLILPPLTGEDGLSPKEFSVPAEAPTGELIEADSQGMKGKLFRVAARLRSDTVTAIPALPFSFFNPQTATYQTVYSQPIALSVKGSAVVGANQVVGTPTSSTANPATTVAISTVGADLALGGDNDGSGGILRVASRQSVLLLLYAVPLLLLLWRVWHERTRDRRGVHTDIRRAQRAADKAILAAGKRPAREGVPDVVSALRQLARVLQRPATDDLLERLENEAFNPAVAESPLRRELCDAARALVKSWGKSPPLPVNASVAALLLAALLPVPTALASDPAYDAYSQALAAKDRDQRRATFARAETYLRVRAQKEATPRVLTDWGNAALGAQEFGTAVLAYRRALLVDRRHARAQKNLSWVRERLPDWLPKKQAGGAVDSLFFWHTALALPERKAVGALAFALAILLLTPWPWGASRRRTLRALAILPALVWIGATTSVLLERDQSQDAVVVAHDSTLRAADSAGAPAALDRPLPAGAEVRALENRNGWIRIALIDGREGWLPKSSLAFVEAHNAKQGR